jgi:hypothetical protein
MATWIFVKAAGPSNAILGKGTPNALDAVVSTLHLALKPLTPFGVEAVKGDQNGAHQCYMSRPKKKRTPESLNVPEVGQEYQ